MYCIGKIRICIKILCGQVHRCILGWIRMCISYCEFHCPIQPQRSRKRNPSIGLKCRGQEYLGNGITATVVFGLCLQTHPISQVIWQSNKEENSIIQSDMKRQYQNFYIYHFKDPTRQKITSLSWNRSTEIRSQALG